MLPRSRFKALNLGVWAWVALGLSWSLYGRARGAKMSTHNTNSHEQDDDFPCATCNRWSQDCCGPWETPQEHEHD